MSESLRRSAWMLAVVAGAYVLSFFHRFAPAGIAQDLAVSFQTTAASLGVLAATYFYVYTVMQVPTGILVDTLGPRRILLLGSLVGGAGSFLFGSALIRRVVRLAKNQNITSIADFLAARYGKDWDTYCQKVPWRMIPGIY